MRSRPNNTTCRSSHPCVGVLTPAGVGTTVEQGKQKVEVGGKAYLLETAPHADSFVSDEKKAVEKSTTFF